MYRVRETRPVEQPTQPCRGGRADEASPADASQLSPVRRCWIEPGCEQEQFIISIKPEYHGKVSEHIDQVRDALHERHDSDMTSATNDSGIKNDPIPASSGWPASRATRRKLLVKKRKSLKCRRTLIRSSQIFKFRCTASTSRASSAFVRFPIVIRWQHDKFVKSLVFVKYIFPNNTLYVEQPNAPANLQRIARRSIRDGKPFRAPLGGGYGEEYFNFGAV